MMQPKNENNALSAAHVLYTAATGGGKTLAVRKLGRINASDQVAFWDPHGDYFGTFKGRKVRHYYDFRSFLRAISAARRTKQGFKIALKVEETRENFLKFIKMCWGFGDGRHPKLFHIVCEENPQVTETVSKDSSIFGKMLQVGRKFGFVVHVVGQRTTEMSKTVVSATPFKFVGMQPNLADARRMADELDLHVDRIKELKPLEYYFKSPGIGNVKKGKLSI